MLKISPLPPSPTNQQIDYTQEATKIAFWETENRLAKMQQLLIQMGIPSHLRGYWHLVWMLEQLLLGNIQLEFVSKDLYPSTAKHFGVTAAAVERDVRYLISWTWRHGEPAQLACFMGQPSTEPPSNTRFMRVFLIHIQYMADGLQRIPQISAA